MHQIEGVDYQEEKQKIARDDKDIPTNEEIKTVLGIGQQPYIENNHNAPTTYNFDEKKRNSRFLGHVNFDGQNHRFVNKNVIKTDLDINFRILDDI